MDVSEMEQEIKTVFKNVKLDGGVSLSQAKVMSDYGEGVTNEEFKNLPRKEITDDWELLTSESLTNYYGELYYEHLSHLDAKGFRYYMPALMLISLNGDSQSNGLTQWLLESLNFKKDDLWNFHMDKVSLLNKEQRSAIAHFLQFIGIINPEDKKLIGRMLGRYWSEYL